MRFTLWIASLWPGCWHAWQLGRWRGLVLAAAFAIALNVALVTTFVWPEWLGKGAPSASVVTAWLVVLGLWSVGIVWLRRDWPRQPCSTGGQRTDGQREALDAMFVEAQHAYLKGHWLEAELALGRLLAEHPLDVEGQLLLASIQRRTKRYREARQTLSRLNDDETARRWRMEIGTELERIDELEEESESATHDVPDDETSAGLSQAA